MRKQYLAPSTFSVKLMEELCDTGVKLSGDTEGFDDGGTGGDAKRFGGGIFWDEEDSENEKK